MKSKKIGILTLHRSLNYGAVWQCWALKNVCEQFGYDVEVIDYADGHRRIRDMLKHRPDKVIKYLRMNRSFNLFVKSQLNPTVHTESPQWLRDNPPQDDIFIVGSDQVWGEKIVGRDFGTFLLDFAPATAKKISYAPSMGGECPTSSCFEELIKGFSAVSLREPSFIDKISELYGAEVTDVCDPSLLLHAVDYQKMEKRVCGLPSQYIAYFNLSGNPFVRTCAESVKKKLGLPIVNLSGELTRWADKSLMGVNPMQWLYVMRNASFICTNSFHGTSFATIFRRPFISVSGKVPAANIRMTNFLSQCGMSSQFIDAISQIDNAFGLDYSLVETSIEAYRQRSLDWLRSALEG